MKHTTIFASAVLAFFVMAGYTSAQEYTSPDDIKAKSADDWRDYQIQGEYTYKYADDDEDVGVQIIADGKGKFTLALYQSGLPGAGWAGERMIAKGELKDGKIEFKPEYMEKLAEFGKQFPWDDPQDDSKKDITATFNVANKTLITPELGKVTMESVSRTSPTLGQKAPEGATVFYDGLSKDATATDMIVDCKGVNPETNALWPDMKTKPLELGKPCNIHVEFMLSFMPNARGQGRSNSGVYLDENYECQVLDSFGLRGESDECGGFYQVARPAVNMCFPPLTWQTYDFDFTPAKFEDGKKVANARVTVLHNGFMIHDNLELPGATGGGRGESPEARGVYFQGHGNKVQYRNIWVQYK